jgi:hypothetical protein
MWRVFDVGLSEESDHFRDVLNFILSVAPGIAAACAVAAIRNWTIVHAENRANTERRRNPARRPRR